MSETSIEWTDKTWNPTRGCSVVSPGCVNCYAMKQAHRYSGAGLPYSGLTKQTSAGPQWTGEVRLVPEKLSEPLRWRKPQRIFVNSMSDLFHESLSDESIARVWWVMGQCVGLLDPSRYRGHTFQILTKRAERMRDWLRGWSDMETRRRWVESFGEVFDWEGGPRYWPDALPDVWLGVSCEDQQRADERIPLLLDTPAAVRFVSAEPLIGALDLSPWLSTPRGFDDALIRAIVEAGITYDECVRASGKFLGDRRTPAAEALSWVIVGGESGPKSRPCDVAWIRSIVGQCRAAGVSAFVKQLGARCLTYGGDWPDGSRLHVGDTMQDARWAQFNDHKGGDPSEWPMDLRVREFPTSRAKLTMA